MLVFIYPYIITIVQEHQKCFSLQKPFWMGFQAFRNFWLGWSLLNFLYTKGLTHCPLWV